MEVDGGKIVSAADAVRVIRDHDTGGFVGIGFAAEIACALEHRFLDRNGYDSSSAGTLRALTLIYPAGQGDGHQRGLNHLGHQGLVRRVIGGHWRLVKLQQLAVANRNPLYDKQVLVDETR